MRGFKIMPWFHIIFFLSFSFCSLEASSNKKLHSAVVVGTVYCDTCLQEDFSKYSHFISAASVAVECKDETSKLSFRQEVKTDEHGEFKVHLPFSVSKHVRRVERCSVQLVSSSEPNCAVASSGTSSSLRLKSRNQGTNIFSAGFFSFKPLKQPNLCNQKPSLENSEKFNTKKTSFPPVDGSAPLDTIHLPPLPLLPSLPPLPQLSPLPPLAGLPYLPPLPQLSPLPPLPGLPYLPPLPGKKIVQELSTETQTQLSKSQQKEVDHHDFSLPQLPPNPLLPPPILPPNPLQPPPLLPPLPIMPPPLLPPNPLVPPPSPIIPVPPIPGLTPSPPAPSFPVPLPPVPGLIPPAPPSSFPIPLPPVQPPPLPRIPLIPPASSSP